MHELTLRKVLKSLLFPLLAASLLSQTALAQSDPFPAKSIRIIASTSPGGLTDLLARNLGRLMSESLGQQVVVENRPGAGTLIGMTACARAPADGYTLCLTDNQSLVFNPLLFSKLPYDPKGDFVPIGGVVRTPNDVIVASPTLPANNLAEVLALARRHPKRPEASEAVALLAQQPGIHLTGLPGGVEAGAGLVFVEAVEVFACGLVVGFLGIEHCQGFVEELAGFVGPA